MPVIVVANPKGGVGKSTLSTNLAGYFAAQGHKVMLGDVDRQQSSRTWLSLRPAAARPIATWDRAREDLVRPPKGTTHVVLDTPAGLHGKRLEQVVQLADAIIVPLQPSIFDIYATRAFLDDVLAHRKSERVRVGVVGMRVKEGTIAADQLRAFAATLEVPVIGYLRDTQNYIQLAARGLTLWDVAPGRVERDLEQWQPIVRWLQS
ncbi:ParA family protein [Caldimonas thermodepolymerans]|uniref:Cobyrinic acid a,c-diamide synthase n=1 Tax=Caldimonas thermodepolymerans TaxID=215580 RepID=A0A2S5T9S4_9BURK|nr:ParA family protein [Caldimonas thermodepolymerans]PPE71706.1 cobyrinic acid a,c-diamide synthase [Caldimonas thermodepolymerans]QPC30732.1 ParA family protein [Caldimonas thermodepolymerans]RDI02649.1 chromosome partitioning protein [Caldimonas thermodepolymerans]